MYRGGLSLANDRGMVCAPSGGMSTVLCGQAAGEDAGSVPLEVPPVAGPGSVAATVKVVERLCSSALLFCLFLSLGCSPLPAVLVFCSGGDVANFYSGNLHLSSGL